MFRTWQPLLPPEIELSMAHLPGRESRWGEAPLSDLSVIASALAEALTVDRRPFALFGHSLGALVAFEVLRHVRRTAGLEPARFFASAHRGPDLPLRHPKIAGLSDRAFVEEVNARHGGIPPEVADNQELMDLMVPSLKADYRLFEEYQHVPERPLACPISVFGGTQDPYLSEADLRAWRGLTTGPFVLRMIEGGHFFVNDHRSSVVATVADELKGVRA